MRTFAKLFSLALMMIPLGAEEGGLPCRPQGVASCAGCHVRDVDRHFPARAQRPCSTYCQGCHFQKETKAHHPVGRVLTGEPKRAELRLEGGRLTCATCHSLATPRTDSKRWKAASLFDRAFRPSSVHKTYLLVMPNDRGQLCKACH